MRIKREDCLCITRSNITPRWIYIYYNKIPVRDSRVTCRYLIFPYTDTRVVTIVVSHMCTSGTYLELYFGGGEVFNNIFYSREMCLKIVFLC